MEKTLFFLDFENINISARSFGVEINYAELLNYIGEGRFLIDSYAYLPINPRNEIGSRRIEEHLWDDGYHVVTKLGTIAGEGMKCNVDIEMAIDILRAAYNCRPDIVVLGSGDADFIPVIGELRKMGIRAEVAAFPNSAAKALIQRCSGFINLEIFLEENHGDLEYPDEIEDDCPEDAGYPRNNSEIKDDLRMQDNSETSNENDKNSFKIPFAKFFG